MTRPMAPGIGFLLSACAVLAVVSGARAADSPADGMEFFETKIRPVLVEHCYECHSAKAKKVRGGLRLDSRARLLAGGDRGPAVVPGDPDKSLLLEAVGYKNPDLQMPKDGKLPDAVIADLAAWVKKALRGARKMRPPPPRQTRLRPAETQAGPLGLAADRPAGTADRQGRRLAARPGGSIHPRQAGGEKSLARAGRRQAHVLRRVTFDLIGLPPTPEEIDAFLKDDSPDAYEKVVDRLLASPHYGERWGRHWLDLVRYAETRGHEFDYPIPNAYQYRDYVIRAFNADVPYDQFVTEQVAGDLLDKPRLNPADGYNESILGTGFWFLGEEVHSPVDVSQDQADRFDNRIDVFGKTFLGLTVACARCHDHKFDAISTKDYYSLFGIMESCNYRLVRFDSWQQNRDAAKDLAEARDRSPGGPARRGRSVAAGDGSHGRLSAGGAGSDPGRPAKGVEDRGVHGGVSQARGGDRRRPQSRRRHAPPLGRGGAGRGEGTLRPAQRLGGGVRRRRLRRSQTSGRRSAADDRRAPRRRRRTRKSWSITLWAGRRTGCPMT